MFKMFNLTARLRRAVACGFIASACIVVLCESSMARADARPLELPVTVEKLPTYQVLYRPTQGRSDVVNFGPRGCPVVQDSVAANFNGINQGSEITLQAGMVVGEGFGSSYVVPDPNPGTPENEAFPIEVTLVEFFVGTAATGIGAPIEMGYRIEVWDGEPSIAGSFIVFSATSGDPDVEPGVPPDLEIQRVTGVPACDNINVLLGGAPASAAKVQFIVDDSDPAERMIVNGDSLTGRFTIMVYMTRANSPGPTQCDTLLPCSNAFFATEGSSVNGVSNPASPTFPTRDWLFGINCGVAACSDYKRFSELPTGLFGCRPTRDVLHQVQYLTSGCAAAPTGACCATNGACSITTNLDCSAGAGAWQGEATACEPNNCPQPMGGCCIAGVCSVTTSSNCSGSGGTYQGNGTTCMGVSCPVPTGACCTTSGGCAVLTALQCAGLGGEYIGNGVACAVGNTCPKGACCLPDGSCQANLSQSACVAMGGLYQGNGAACGGVSCPQPNGACCSTTGSCVQVDQALCGLFGGTWQGPLTTCDPDPCVPATGACCDGSSCSISTALDCSGDFGGAGSTCEGWPNNPITCCRANLSQTDGVDLADLIAFLTDWQPNLGTNAPGALSDWNGDATIDLADLVGFLTDWQPGCS